MARKNKLNFSHRVGLILVSAVAAVTLAVCILVSRGRESEPIPQPVAPTAVDSLVADTVEKPASKKHSKKEKPKKKKKDTKKKESKKKSDKKAGKESRKTKAKNAMPGNSQAVTPNVASPLDDEVNGK